MLVLQKFCQFLDGCCCLDSGSDLCEPSPQNSPPSIHPMVSFLLKIFRRNMPFHKYVKSISGGSFGSFLHLSSVYLSKLSLDFNPRSFVKIKPLEPSTAVKQIGLLDVNPITKLVGDIGYY